MGVPAAKRKMLKAALVKYRGTGSLSDSDAEKYGPELHRITAKHGLAAPEIIVAEAKRKDNPLHEFIWDLSDTEAARQHRLDQATYLVRHVVEIVVDDASGESVQIRPFIHVEEEEQEGYRERHAVDPERYRDMRLSEATTLLRSFVNRFADLTEFASLTKMVRRLLKLRGEHDQG